MINYYKISLFFIITLSIMSCQNQNGIEVEGAQLNFKYHPDQDPRLTKHESQALYETLGNGKTTIEDLHSSWKVNKLSTIKIEPFSLDSIIVHHKGFRDDIILFLNGILKDATKKDTFLIPVYSDQVGYSIKGLKEIEDKKIKEAEVIIYSNKWIDSIHLKKPIKGSGTEILFKGTKQIKLKNHSEKTKISREEISRKE